jgi:hypothetical protein
LALFGIEKAYQDNGMNHLEIFKDLRFSVLSLPKIFFFCVAYIVVYVTKIVKTTIKVPEKAR